jgi:hypothetical protein
MRQSTQITQNARWPCLAYAAYQFGALPFFRTSSDQDLYPMFWKLAEALQLSNHLQPLIPTQQTSRIVRVQASIQARLEKVKQTLHYYQAMHGIPSPSLDASIEAFHRNQMLRWKGLDSLMDESDLMHFANLIQAFWKALPNSCLLFASLASCVQIVLAQHYPQDLDKAFAHWSPPYMNLQELHRHREELALDAYNKLVQAVEDLTAAIHHLEMQRDQFPDLNLDLAYWSTMNEPRRIPDAVKLTTELDTYLVHRLGPSRVEANLSFWREMQAAEISFDHLGGMVELPSATAGPHATEGFGPQASLMPNSADHQWIPATEAREIAEGFGIRMGKSRLSKLARIFPALFRSRPRKHHLYIEPYSFVQYLLKVRRKQNSQANELTDEEELRERIAKEHERKKATRPLD